MKNSGIDCYYIFVKTPLLEELVINSLLFLTIVVQSIPGKALNNLKLNTRTG